MTPELVLVPLALVLSAVLLVALRRERRSGGLGLSRPVRPFRAAALADVGHLDLATDWVHTRLGARAPDRASLRQTLQWIREYVCAHSRPLNGEGRALGIEDSSGWLVAPNMFDVVRDLQRRAGAAGLSLDVRCAWEICGLHDDFLRSRTG